MYYTKEVEKSIKILSRIGNKYYRLLKYKTDISKTLTEGLDISILQSFLDANNLGTIKSILSNDTNKQKYDARIYIESTKASIEMKFLSYILMAFNFDFNEFIEIKENFEISSIGYFAFITYREPRNLTDGMSFVTSKRGLVLNDINIFLKHNQKVSEDVKLWSMLN
jgi:hypothetical protein